MEEAKSVLQVDGINDLEYEWPGKVEVVMGEAEEERNGSGSWVLVGRRADELRQVQRKARKEVATKYPNMVRFYGGGDTGVDFIMKYFEEAGDYLEVVTKELEKNEKLRGEEKEGEIRRRY